ncbi:glycosyltransferase [Aliamphritea spongicola]|uniref:glycosyltransferase n=1 Tax=Aliamphritea spongicola TaxID=707589 RepID=UPI00196AA8D7|nr:glycosyltransferase [Aliamphritea spongicola]MBN3561352.1 glycosyltransferase [Aliamphritea spongicola]
MSSLSVVIPVGPAEKELGDLPFSLLQVFRHTSGLGLLLKRWEIIVVLCEASRHLEQQLSQISAVTVLYAEAGRAKQMNAGAAAATGRFIWFLHLDSNIEPLHCLRLSERILQNSEALHYFPLAFKSDGAGPMRLNQWGANVRSNLLRVPFGDQAFCLSARQFRQLGGYPEEAEYGEDHLLVWYARQAGITLCSTGIALPTSARKYASHGWLKLTLRYQYLWLKQAWPEFLCLLKRRFL